MKLHELRHPLGPFDALYLMDEDTRAVSLVLLPAGMDHAYANRRPDLMDTAEMQRLAIDCPAWSVGSLCHLALRHHPQCTITGMSLLHGYSTLQLKYADQQVSKADGKTVITTRLEAEEGYAVDHILTHWDGDDGVEVQTVFRNCSQKVMQLDLLTSFALDNLSPFAVNAAPNTMRLHRFYGGWSAEGRRRADDIEALNLERSWYNGRPSCERFGCVGSYPVDRWFPVAAVEDKSQGVFWGAQLAHNGSWQMELSRASDCLAFTGGLADCEFGSWFKLVQPGEAFAAPKAFLSVAKGDLETLCNQMTALHQKYMPLQPAVEQELPMIYNEWCTSWGHPTEQLILDVAHKLQGSPVKYLVIDGGWSRTTNSYLGQGGNGDWIPEDKQFPNGLLHLSREIQAMGFELGIWYEFEVTTKGARVAEPDYDHLHLQRNGEVIYSGDTRSFWDFRKPEVIAFLRERVLDLLRDNEIRFMKVDYNCSIGIGCDGAESPGEGLRQQLDAVREFFLTLRRELPDLVIENCASGGHRLEPSMMDITALSSGTDAHESGEIPVIAANSNLLFLPRQNEIWCVLDKTHTEAQTIFRLTSGFLGRMCLSGDILDMPDSHWRHVEDAMDFYAAIRGVIKDCSTHLHQHFATKSIRYVEGTQAVVMEGKNGQTLVVCHSFNNACPEAITFPIPAGLQVLRTFADTSAVTRSGDTMTIAPLPDQTAFALLLG